MTEYTPTETDMALFYAVGRMNNGVRAIRAKEEFHRGITKIRQDAKADLIGNLNIVNNLEEADHLPPGDAIQTPEGKIYLRTNWGSGWATAEAGDDYPRDTKSCFPALVLPSQTES